MGYFFAATGLLALVSLVSPAVASQADERLDGIFAHLQTTGDDSEAAALTQLIWEIWHQSDNDTVNDFMSKGIEEMSIRNYRAALAAFNTVVEIEPNFAEGWNKRATVYYLMREYELSVHDLERTLALEPRHFGALSGLGLVFLAIGNEGAALKAFEAALKVNPHMPGAQTHAEQLRRLLRSKSF